MKYRIIELSNGKYMAQTRPCFPFPWEGIDSYHYVTWDTWKYQVRHCAVSTAEEAMRLINRRKEKLVKENKVTIKRVVWSE